VLTVGAPPNADVISSFTCGTTFTAQPDGSAMIWMQPVQAAGYPLSEFFWIAADIRWN
jgi:hypothetical protein